MEHLTELIHIITELTDKEVGEGTPWGLGSQQGDRIMAVADYCTRILSGDLLEIGCYSGGTTQLLARVAKRRGRKVLAIDPWVDDPVIYKRFLENMADFMDLLDIVRLPSQDERAIEQIKTRPLCFAFIDGLHEHEALICDIQTVGHCKGIIAVDDVSYECEPENLRPACWEGAKRLDRQLYWHNKCREAYLVP